MVSGHNSAMTNGISQFGKSRGPRKSKKIEIKEVGFWEPNIVKYR